MDRYSIDLIRDEEARDRFFVQEGRTKMNFVKIGKRVVNLNNVTEMRYKPDGGYSNRQPCVTISFVGETENYTTVYKSDEPEAFSQLMTWMDERPALLSDEV